MATTADGQQVDISQLLHGPSYGANDPDKAGKEVCVHYQMKKRDGSNMYDWDEWQRAAAASDPYYAADPTAVNIVVQDVMMSDKELPFLTNLVVLGHPEDCKLHNPRGHLVAYACILTVCRATAQASASRDCTSRNSQASRRSSSARPTTQKNIALRPFNVHENCRAQCALRFVSPRRYASPD